MLSNLKSEPRNFSAMYYQDLFILHFYHVINDSWAVLKCLYGRASIFTIFWI